MPLEGESNSSTLLPRLFRPKLLTSNQHNLSGQLSGYPISYPAKILQPPNELSAKHHIGHKAIKP